MVLGRQDRQVKIRGARVELQDASCVVDQLVSLFVYLGKQVK